MKRRNEYSEGSSPLRKRISSLFSIPSVRDDDDDPEVVEEHKHENSGTDTGTVIFFDEEDGMMRSLERREPESSKTYLPSVSLDASDKTPTKYQTGLVIESGNLHYDRSNRLHKERPLRIETVVETLKREGVYDQCIPLKDRIQLEDEDYYQTHMYGYMYRLEKLSACTSDEFLNDEAEQYKSIYFTRDSTKAAKNAAESLCTLVTHVVRGDLDNGFAVIRPPGHHAEPSIACGYCLINNVAVAASYARAKLGVNKILICDWDVHHGNGTQSSFYEDPNVLYFSVHRGGGYFPFLANSGPMNVGMKDGEGFNVNVSWSRKGMGDREYQAVWEHILMPVAREYNADLILLSAGFDAADGDLGECLVTPTCFASLMQQLMTLGKVAATLEGGYVRSILGKCIARVVQTMLGMDDTEEASHIPLESIDKVAAENIKSTIAAHKSYWKCLG